MTMSAIVPWTTPGGTPCCCCSNTQPSTHSLLMPSSAAFAALLAGGTIQYDLGVAVNIGSNGSSGSSATMIGTFNVRVISSIANGGCTASSTLVSAVATTDTITCTPTSPASPPTWTLTTQSCAVNLGSLGLFAYLLDGNKAYISVAATISGAFQFIWSSNQGSSESSGIFSRAFITQASGTNGNISLVINGETFNLPVLFSSVDTYDFGTVSYSIGPTITFTSNAP